MVTEESGEIFKVPPERIEGNVERLDVIILVDTPERFRFPRVIRAD